MRGKVPFYDSWEGQRELEKAIRTRTLYRPKTKKSLVFFIGSSYFLLALGATMPLFFLEGTPLLILGICFFEVALFETVARWAAIKFIRCYQHYAKEEIRRRCCCVPSCSDYAIACLKRFPMIIAVPKIHRRLFKTCNGEMYKLDKPYKKYVVKELPLIKTKLETK